jgi:hypothetical protein
MMDKLPKTRTELEALVLAELRAAPQCGSAVHVTVVPYDNYRVPATWEVASFDPGTSEWEECERALCDIVSRLQQRHRTPSCAHELQRPRPRSTSCGCVTALTVLALAAAWLDHGF